MLATPKRKWHQRTWVRLVLLLTVLVTVILAVPGFAFYRAWIRPSKPQPVWNHPLSTKERQQIFNALGAEVSRLHSYGGSNRREWSATLAQFRPRAEAAATNTEFYEILAEMLATLKDGHTRLTSYPGAITRAVPPLKILMTTDGHYAVAAIGEGVDPQIRPGDIPLMIDGRAVAEVLAERRRILSASSESQAEAALGYGLLGGAAGSSATVRFRRPDGSEYEATLLRSLSSWSEPFAARTIDGLGYIYIPLWTGDVDRQFAEALEPFKDAPGLIIDVRGNGGGNDALAEAVIGRLIDQRTVWAKTRVRFGPFWTPWGERAASPTGPWTYTGQIAVLIDGRVFSSNDFFVGGLVQSGRAVAVGSPTGGGSGNPARVYLPGGAQVTISRWQEAYPDGTLIEGNPTQPTFLVIPSVADLAAGRDPVLERAVEILKASP